MKIGKSIKKVTNIPDKFYLSYISNEGKAGNLYIFERKNEKYYEFYTLDMTSYKRTSSVADYVAENFKTLSDNFKIVYLKENNKGGW